MLKHTKQFIKGFKEGYEGNSVKTQGVPEEKDDSIIAEILDKFEKEVPSRDVWEIYEDFEHWLLFTRPKEGGINLKPHYILSKNTRSLKSVALTQEELFYGMRNPPIFERESDKNKWEDRIYECLMISTYEEDFIEICDTVMRVDVQIPIIGDSDRDEIGIRYSGEVVKGDISRNDVLEIISFDLQKEKKLIPDFVEIRNTSSEKSAIIFKFENQDDIRPIYFIKIDDSKRKDLDVLYETIQKEIDS